MAPRYWFKPLIARTQELLEPGERVIELAPGRGRTAGAAAYLPGWLAFLIALVALWIALGDDDFWTAFAVALAASLLVDWLVRRRQQRSMVSRALVTVTDRRLLHLVSPYDLMQVPLGAVQDVEVTKSGFGFATVRLLTNQGQTDVEVMSDWPKRGARAAADAIAMAARSPSHVR